MFDLFGTIQQTYAAWGWPAWAYNLTYALITAVLIIAFIGLNALFLIWLERKVAGHIQQRLGPMRVGPHGLLQTIADMFKLLSKEDIIPSGADQWVFRLAPIVAFAPAMMVYIVIPWSPTWSIQDLNIGLIYVAAVTSLIVISLLMAGWSSNNKWSLLGAMRSAAQLVSYEIPLVLSVIAVVMLAGSLSLQDVVRAQAESVWYILLQPVGFIIFFIATIAELNRAPFDLPEAESELVSGFNTEYSGIRWGIFFLSEYGNMVSASAIAAVLFLGGWHGPAFLPPVVWLLLKTYLLVFVIMWVRWTFPRIRVDHLMTMGWKVLVPLSLVNLGLTGAGILLFR